MKPSDIQVGKTYCNRGKGKTRRTVLEISHDLKAPWHSDKDRPSEAVVRYSQRGTEENLYISSFAAWVGKEASKETE